MGRIHNDGVKIVINGKRELQLKKKLIPASDIFKEDDWKLSKWKQFKIGVNVKISCIYYKLKHRLLNN